MSRPVALVTGVGRRAGLGAAIAIRLAEAGWDVATTYWGQYDGRMPWGEDPDRVEIERRIEAAGGRSFSVEADFEDPETPARVVGDANDALGPLSGLVLAHCESVDSTIMDTTVESFDRHYVVNVRAAWSLIRAFAEQYPDGHPNGRILALTSDHVVGNVPYGVTKGALDRLVIAAASELASLGLTANVVDPGPVDTGWMDADLRQVILDATPAGRLATPEDTADLVEFLCSDKAGWITGQRIRSDGGLGR